MDTRPGLIERAAALLRDERSQDERSQSGPGRFEAANLAMPPGAGSPRAVTRTCVLDRVALAEFGIIMPWSTTRRVGEEFRIVKRNLMTHWNGVGYSQRSNGWPRTVMITSVRPREGKTFAAINLALSFAAEEHLTAILIDADAVRGDTAKYLKVPAQPGLTEVLSGKVSLSDALIQTDLPNLVILPSGEHGPHVPELLTSRGLNVIFAELGRRYPEHVIVIDTAPVLASTAPAGFAPMVDQIVFVLEAGQTQRPEIESALSLLSSCPHISFLLNKAPPSSEHFGSYPYYGAWGDTSGKVAID